MLAGRIPNIDAFGGAFGGKVSASLGPALNQGLATLCLLIGAEATDIAAGKYAFEFRHRRIEAFRW